MKPVETSMPGAASLNPVESRGFDFLSSVQVVPPSVEVRCGISIRPGQALNEFGNMCSTPSFSMTAPGLMYLSPVPASFVSTTASLAKVNRWVTGGGGVGVVRGVAAGLAAADPAGALGPGAVPVPHAARTAASRIVDTRRTGLIRGEAAASCGDD